MIPQTLNWQVICTIIIDIFFCKRCLYPFLFVFPTHLIGGGNS